MLIAYVGYQNGEFSPANQPENQEVSQSESIVSGQRKAANDNNVVITNYAKQHILHGNKSGGGHKYGTGKPCKSEFPKSWNDEKILYEVKKIAANDNTNWNQEQNGYYVTEKSVEGINVRVVIGSNKTNIVTAYPTNTKRNPCDTYNE